MAGEESSTVTNFTSKEAVRRLEGWHWRWASVQEAMLEKRASARIKDSW